VLDPIGWRSNGVAHHTSVGPRANPTRDSRRGQGEAPTRIDESLGPGLTFMTFRVQDEVLVKLLTVDATDP
jgi:hypothetical protein